MAKSSKSSAATQQLLHAASSQVLEPLRAAKREWSRKLLVSVTRGERVRALTAAVSPVPERNVVGVGVGEKVTADQPTGILALKFLVRVKYPASQLAADHLLPKTVNGLPVDVEEVGLFRRFAARTSAKKGKSRKAVAAAMPNPRTKIRPAQPGCSVGFRDPADQFVMAGTFGALVKDITASYILSNNHVLADEGRLPIDSPIFQPGLLDGGNPNTDQIAKLTRFEPLQAGVVNQVDCAMARTLKTSLVSHDILFIGPPQGVGQAALDMVVHKFGRTTSYTVGRVTSIDTDVTVQYDTGQYTFESQIIIVGLGNQAFSDAGDSGSLILERRTQTAVGLLFAGSTSHTIANHLENVLQALKVQLA